MIRIVVASVIFAGSIAVLPTPQANAQSPDPALLAPGQSGRMMAPPRYTKPTPSHAPAGHRDVYRSQRGARLSHPSTHIH
jgi:hypothetical protein